MDEGSLANETINETVNDTAKEATKETYVVMTTLGALADDTLVMRVRHATPDLMAAVRAAVDEFLRASQENRDLARGYGIRHNEYGNSVLFRFELPDVMQLVDPEILARHGITTMECLTDERNMIHMERYETFQEYPVPEVEDEEDEEDEEA